MATRVCSSPVPESDITVVRLPLSKSIAARMLVCAFWRRDCLDCMVLPDCDDTRTLRSALARLQADMEMPPESAAAYSLGEGGTSLRFFLPVMASLPGAFGMVDCAEALRRRPSGILVNALRQAGAVLKGSGPDSDRAPFMVTGTRLLGGTIAVDAGVSSQFVSALMLSAPQWERGVRIEMTDEGCVSRPYLEMTAVVMRRMGARCEVSRNVVEVSPGGYDSLAPVAEVETDWSAASYFYEWLLISGRGSLCIPGLLPPETSLQGDSGCCRIFERLGVRTEWTAGGDAILSVGDMTEEMLEEDMNGMPDLVPALAVGCALAGVKFRFSGVGHLRHKECDRMSALASELRKLGYVLEEGDDEMSWTGACCSPDSNPVICTRGDHRMAMAFAPAGLRFHGLTVDNPGCVTKSFPRFWEEFEKLLNIEQIRLHK